MILAKARPIQMNKIYMEGCKTEIQGLPDKRLIRRSSSYWSRAAFYKNVEQERGILRLVINKPLNKILQWISYLIPNKKDLLNNLIMLASEFWAVQITKPTMEC